MTDPSFLDNTNINESNSLVNLVHHLNPSNEHKLNLIEHSIYYNNKTFRHEISYVNGSISDSIFRRTLLGYYAEGMHANL